MSLLTQGMTLLVNALVDGFLSSVNDVAVIDVTGLSSVSIFVNQIGDFAILDLGGLTTHINTKIRAKVAGATPHIVIQPGAGAGAGTISEVGNVVTITYKTAVTTVTQFEALVAQSTLIAVLTAGTGANVLATTGDDLADTALSLSGNTFTIKVEKSVDGVNWALLATVTEADLAQGDNTSKEITMSNSNGMPTYAKQVRARLTAMLGTNQFAVLAAGQQMDGYR